ncbi:MAG: hypothetical protein IIT39_07475 [Clostridia bacterium]|nr:hypothetical protein [Clostridia bacterium]
MTDIKEKSAPETAISETETKNYDTAIINQAVKKINPKLKKLNKYAAVIAEPTAKALHGFCRQSEEFARAVVETDKTFQDCLETITKDIGRAVSDIEVYQKAVEFFFPGAKVEFKMIIHMSEYELNDNEPSAPAEPVPEPEQKKDIDLSLGGLLDW